MKQNITKRNHYLPQLYLKSFLSNDVFWVYYKKGEHPVAQAPINTCVETHIYNFKNPDGSINDSIEKALRITENDVKDVIEKLLNPKARLETNDIPKLAEFLSFIATRVPRSINLAREITKEMAVNDLKKISQKQDEIEKMLDDLNMSNEITVDQVQKYFENPEEYFKLSTDEKHAMGMSLVISKDIYYELMDMNWCLCKAPSGYYFITSDAPLVAFVLYSDSFAMIGSGFGLDNVEVIIPISPFVCLYMSRKHPQRYRAVNKKFVMEINRRTAWNAERLIISNIKTKYVKELTFWASKSLSIPKIDKELLEYFYQNFETLGN